VGGKDCALQKEGTTTTPRMGEEEKGGPFVARRSTRVPKQGKTWADVIGLFSGAGKSIFSIKKTKRERKKKAVAAEKKGSIIRSKGVASTTGTKMKKETIISEGRAGIQCKKSLLFHGEGRSGTKLKKKYETSLVGGGGGGGGGGLGREKRVVSPNRKRDASNELGTRKTHKSLWRWVQRNQIKGEFKRTVRGGKRGKRSRN